MIASGQRKVVAKKNNDRNSFDDDQQWSQLPCDGRQKSIT